MLCLQNVVQECCLGQVRPCSVQTAFKDYRYLAAAKESSEDSDGCASFSACRVCCHDGKKDKGEGNFPIGCIKVGEQVRGGPRAAGTSLRFLFSCSLTYTAMCQFCGVDPAFAAYFENNDNNGATVTQVSEMSEVPPSTDNVAPAPNFFRLKPTNKRYQAGGRITTQQLTTFASSLSAEARLLMGHHGQTYHDALRRWSKCAVKPALAIVMPAIPEDVSKTVSR